MKKSKSLLFLLILVFIAHAKNTGVNAVTCINADYNSNSITQVERLEYLYYAYVKPDALPNQYQGLPVPSNPPRSLTPLVMSLFSNWDDLSEKTKKIYKEMSSISPNAKRWTSRSGHFLIFYYESGEDAVPMENLDGDTVPDYVQTVGAAFDSAWRKEVTELGYNTPNSYSPIWISANDKNKYKVSLENLESNIYGYTTPMLTGGTFVQMRNNYDGFVIQDWKKEFLNDYGKNPSLAINVTAAHEFFHALQSTYVKNITDYMAWSEGTAVYMEEINYPKINDYLQYIQDFFWRTELPLHYQTSTNLHEYAVCVWPIYLAKRFGDETVKLIWEKMEYLDKRNQLEETVYNAYDSVLVEKGSSLKKAFLKFAQWSYFTNDRSDTVLYFPESDLYPPVNFFDTLVVDDSYKEIKSSVNTMGFKWYSIKPDNAKSRVIEFMGRNKDDTDIGSGWAVCVVAYDSTKLIKPKIVDAIVGKTGSVSLKVDNWDSYTNISLVAVNANTQDEQYFSFNVVAPEYDSIKLNAGESKTIKKLEDNFSVTVHAKSNINSVLEFSYTIISPNESDSTLQGLNKFFGVNFVPNIDQKIKELDIKALFDNSDILNLTNKSIRLEQLSAYVLQDDKWVFVDSVVVNYRDSTLSFSSFKTGTFGFFYQQPTSNIVCVYPSPADFRNYRNMFIDVKDGLKVDIYTVNGKLVRMLNSNNLSEYKVNRFVWNGLNQKGRKAKSGIYYYVVKSKTMSKRGKIIVIR